MNQNQNVDLSQQRHAILEKNGAGGSWVQTLRKKNAEIFFFSLRSVWESNKYKFKSHSFHMVEAGTNNLCHSLPPHPPPCISLLWTRTLEMTRGNLALQQWH